MKRFFVGILTSMFIVHGAFSQGAAGELIKQKALQQRDINNQQQGVISSAAAATTPSAPAAPQGPQGMSAAQQQLIDRLQADLAGIKPGALVSDGQKQQLQSDFAALAKGATKPSAQRLAKLAEDLTTALAAENINIKDPAQLAKDINIVMNSGNPSLTPAQADSFVIAAQKSLRTGGVGTGQAMAVTVDLKAITRDLQQTKAKLYQ